MSFLCASVAENCLDSDFSRDDERRSILPGQERVGLFVALEALFLRIHFQEHAERRSGHIQIYTVGGKVFPKALQCFTCGVVGFERLPDFLGTRLAPEPVRDVSCVTESAREMPFKDFRVQV